MFLRRNRGTAKGAEQDGVVVDRNLNTYEYDTSINGDNLK